MLLTLLGTLWLGAPPALAAPCDPDQGLGTTELREQFEAALTLHIDGDRANAIVAASAVEWMLPCILDPLAPDDVYRLHFVAGLRDQHGDRRDAAVGSLRSAIYGLSLWTRLPAEDPLRAIATGRMSTASRSLPMALRGRLLINGYPTRFSEWKIPVEGAATEERMPRRPGPDSTLAGAIPIYIQRIGQGGVVLGQTTIMHPGDRIPYRKLSTVFFPLSASLFAASIGLMAAAATSERRFKDDPSAIRNPNAYRRTTNTFGNTGIAAAILGGGALAAGFAVEF